MKDKNEHVNMQHLFYKISNSIRWWAYAAWSLPFISLAVLLIEKLAGLESLYHNTALMILFCFFVASTYWWWWAMDTIFRIVKQLNSAESRILEIKSEISQTRLIIKKDHVDYR